MPDGNLENAVRVLLDAVRRELEREDVRLAVRQLAAWFGEALTPSPPESPPAGPVATSPATLIRPAPAVVAGPKLVPPPLHKAPLRVGDALLEVIVPGTPEEASAAARSAAPRAPTQAEHHSRWPAVPADQLDLASRRAALKAEVAQLLFDRGAGAAPSTSDDQLRTRLAGIGGGRLWLLDDELPAGADLLLIARCSENLSTAARLAGRIQRRIDTDAAPPHSPSLTVLAEVQSALRAAALTAGIEDEEDQMILFSWLRVTCDVHRVFIDRFMRARQLADPHRWQAQRDELAHLVDEIEGQPERAAAKKKLLNKARFHVKKLAADPAGGQADDWQSLDEAVTALLAAGEAPSSQAVREALTPLASSEPAAYAPGRELKLALREVARFLEQRSEADDDGDSDEPPNPDVAEAARLLRGRVVLLIGGVVKEHRRQAIERAFELGELRWIGANMNDASTGDFEPQLRRPETSLVVRMVRFTRTHHGELMDLCKRYNRPFVNLPAGYGVNQLAAEVLAQAGDQLRALAAAEASVPAAG
jgi:hypothetical protein